MLLRQVIDRPDDSWIEWSCDWSMIGWTVTLFTVPKPLEYTDLKVPRIASHCLVHCTQTLRIYTDLWVRRIASHCSVYCTQTLRIYRPESPQDSLPLLSFHVWVSTRAGSIDRNIRDETVPELGGLGGRLSTLLRYMWSRDRDFSKFQIVFKKARQCLNLDYKMDESLNESQQLHLPGMSRQSLVLKCISWPLSFSWGLN